MLDLDHRALARLVDALLRLHHHAVEPRALEARQPVGGHRAVAGCRRQVNRRRRAGERALELLPPFRLRSIPHVRAVDGEQVEGHERRRARLRELRDARRRRMQPQLQRVEVEAVRRRDHDLAVDDAIRREPGQQRFVQLGKIRDRAAAGRGSGCTARRRAGTRSRGSRPTSARRGTVPPPAGPRPAGPASVRRAVRSRRRARSSGSSYVRGNHDDAGPERPGLQVSLSFRVGGAPGPRSSRTRGRPMLPRRCGRSSRPRGRVHRRDRGWRGSP